MKTTQKTVNNLLRENIYHFKVSSLNQDLCHIYVKTHISNTKSFNIRVSIRLTTLPHMLNGYEICLNTTNYPIINMQDFIYWLYIWHSNMIEA